MYLTIHLPDPLPHAKIARIISEIEDFLVKKGVSCEIHTDSPEKTDQWNKPDIDNLVVDTGSEYSAKTRRVIAFPNTFRPYALCAGEFSVSDDFDDPLPEYILNEFEGYETAA